MTLAPIIYSSLVIVAILYYFIANSEGKEFSASLIHRDSPISPLYNPHETSSQRIEKTLNRSINRVNYLSSDKNSTLIAYSGLIPDISGDYLMNISIGTPPFQILVIADTGSNVLWTKCSAFPNKGILFTPSLSSTYETMPCPSRVCDHLGDRVCHYKISYGGDSHTLGDFAFETLTLKSRFALEVILVQNTLIGCSYDSKFSFPTKASGIIGLGRGYASLINQLGPFIDWKFSYCLPHSDRKSTIHFGRNVTGDGVVSTPLIYDPSRPLFFFLKLEAMSVGNVRIPFRGSASENQNILIDSGTVYTMLPNEFFSQLSSEVARQIVGRLRVGSPFSSFFKLCYELGPTGTINAPPITMNFVGADVELPLSNVFIQISDKVTCFAFLPRDDGFSIYGNFAQQNFLVGYDLHNNAVSFKPSNCGRK
ncbi:Aspartic proteinase CDR1 [Linum grandiflorum]